MTDTTAGEGVRRSVMGGKITWYFGKNGAHLKLPGFLYTRYCGIEGWSSARSWRVLGLICLRHHDARGGVLKHCKPEGWSVTYAVLDIKAAFRKANNHVY